MIPWNDDDDDSVWINGVQIAEEGSRFVDL